MSIEKRIENLEKRTGGKEGCKVIIVTYEGTASPPDGATRRYIEENNLCKDCTRKDGLCWLYWNGETFTREPRYPQHKNVV